MIPFIKQHPKTSVAITLVAMLLLALPLLLQSTIKQVIFDYTQPYGVQKVELEEIDFNVFSGKVVVKNLELIKAQDNTEISSENIKIGELNANLAMLELLKKRIYITNLTFNNAQLPFTLNEKLQPYLGGIPLFSQTPDTADNSETTKLEFGVDSLAFNNIQVSLNYQKQITTFNLQSLTLSQLASWSSNYARGQFKAQINDQPLQANLQLHLFSEQPKVLGTFKAESIDSAWFQKFIDASGALKNQNSAMKLGTQLAVDITFTAEQTNKGYQYSQQGQVEAKNAYFESKINKVKQKAGLEKINWNGDLVVSINNQNNSQSQTVSALLSGKFKINNGAFNSNDSLAPIDLKFSSLQSEGEFEFNQLASQANGLSLKAKQSININGVNLKANNQTTLKTQISLNTQSEFKTNTKGLSFNHNGSLSLASLEAVQNTNTNSKISTTLKQFKHQGQFSFTQKPKQPANLSASGKVGLNSFTLGTQKQNSFARLVGLQSLNISKLNVVDLNQINTGPISLNNLQLTDVSNQPFIQANELNIGYVTFNQNPNKATQVSSLELGNIVLNSSETHITLNKQNQVVAVEGLKTQLDAIIASTGNSTDTINSVQTAKTSVKPAAENAQPTQFNYQLMGLEIQGNNPIHLKTVQPEVSKTFNLTQLSLGAINSQAPNQATPYSVNVSFSEFSNLTSKGEITALDPTQYLNANTEVDGFSLPDISSLSEQTIGYQVQTGQLNGEFKTELKNNQINAKNKVTISKLKLKAGTTDAAKKAQESFPVPLETGIAMIKDRNDNIQLNIPVNGDISNPNFQISEVINKAIGNALAGATKTYLLLALQPFGAIALAGDKLFDSAGKIRLESIEFAPGEDEITLKTQQYLAKISELLKSRQQLQLQLCGGASELDRNVIKKQNLRKTIEKQSQAGVKDINVPNINIEDQALLDLATQRQTALKRALLKLGVSTNQVLLCTPQINKKRVTPSINLKL